MTEDLFNSTIKALRNLSYNNFPKTLFLRFNYFKWEKTN